MAFNIWALFYDNAGRPVYDTDAANLVGLTFSYKLDGGDAVAQFRLVGNMFGRLRWASGYPDATDLLLVTPGMLPDSRITGGNQINGLWRGRFVRVTLDEESRTYVATYMGYWRNTARQLWDANYVAGGTATTLKTIVEDAITAGVMPLIDGSDTGLIEDPGVVVNPSGGRDFPIDKKYPREIFQQLVREGDGSQRYHFAVWADRRIRLFPRDLTLRWQVWPGMGGGSMSHTLTQENMASRTWAPYKDTSDVDQWYSTTDDAAVATILGETVDQRISNPWVNQAAAEGLATQFQNDHNRVEDQGAGITLGPHIMNAYGAVEPSYMIRPGHVIRVIDQASFDLDGAVNNTGNYYVMEVSVNVDDETVTIVPDMPQQGVPQATAQLL